MRALAAIGLCLAFAAGAAAAAAANVQSLILKPGQVGTGYVLFQRTDGLGLKTRTLDLCGVADYPSEALRTARIQVNYLKRNAPIGISNEVVSYKPGGTVQAMREVIAHATGCPHHAISPGEQNLPPLTFQITRLHDSKLLKGYLAVRVRVIGKVSGKHVDQTSCAVYQRQGNVLSGVYSFGAATAAQMELCLHAAEQSAKNLRSTVPKGPTA
jgi:hypothetical protein